MLPIRGTGPSCSLHEDMRSCLVVSSLCLFLLTVTEDVLGFLVPPIISSMSATSLTSSTSGSASSNGETFSSFYRRLYIFKYLQSCQWMTYSNIPSQRSFHKGSCITVYPKIFLINIHLIDLIGVTYILWSPLAITYYSHIAPYWLLNRVERCTRSSLTSLPADFGLMLNISVIFLCLYTSFFSSIFLCNQSGCAIRGTGLDT